MEYEKLGENSDGDVNSGVFKEVCADCTGKSPDDKCPSMCKLEQVTKLKKRR